MKKIVKHELWELETQLGKSLNVNYGPDINIGENDERSLFYVKKENYDLNDIDSLFKYLMDAEEAYNEADDYYTWDGKQLNMEYDEDRYISYHFENIPEHFLEKDEFALRFFLDEDNKPDQWCYGTNIFKCHNSVSFNVKNIDTVIKIFDNIHHNYRDWFDVMQLNGTALIDIINEYSEEERVIIKNDWVDEELVIDYLNKYKICKEKERLEEKYPEKNTTEKRGKI